MNTNSSSKHRLLTLTALVLTIVLALFVYVSSAAPGNPVLYPPRSSHTAPLTTTIFITYDEPISAATVTSQTFAIHAMQSGLVTATHSVNGNTIIVTPTHPLHQSELVYAIATTRTLNITGTAPLSSTQWQFNAGKVISRCVAGFTDINAGLPGVDLDSSVAWGDYDNDGDLDILLAGWAGSTVITRLYRNDGPSSGWSFTEVSTGLPGMYDCAVAWGDYDSDGDLDILLAGFDGSGQIARIYRNDGPSSSGWTFTDINAGLLGVIVGSVAWGDYDNDGDLDILLTGLSGSTYVTRVYRNGGPSSGWSFTNIGANLIGVSRSSAAWGDYNNDGNLDILLTGCADYSCPTGIARVYRNDGPPSGWSFTDIGAGLTGVYYSSVAWGDYDSDGDLDILLEGFDGQTGRFARVYRNDGPSSGWTFTDINAGLPGVQNGEVAWGDYDNDGDLDILLTGSPGVARVYRNDGPSSGWSFTDIGAGLPIMGDTSAAWGDYDNDGDLDILLTGGVGWPNKLAGVYSNKDCADLSIIKTTNLATAVSGQTITYTLVFSYAAPPDGSTATGVVIADPIPISVTNTSVISSGVIITQTSPNYAWQVQDLAPGQGGIITITGVISNNLPAGHILTNTATITSMTSEANTTNNADSAVLLVDKANTTVAIGSLANPSLFGQPVVLTATVAVIVPGAGTPTGIVTFTEGATTLGSGTLDGSRQATLTVSSLAVGDHTITATYAGDDNFNSSASLALGQTVNKAGTMTSLTSLTNPSVLGQSITFTVTVSATEPGAGTPTGTVTLTDGATILDTITLSDGAATFSTSALSVGPHSITVSYSGNGSFNSSTSTPLPQTVNKANTTTVLTSTDSSSVFGQSVTFTATVSAVAPGMGIPTGEVTFTEGITTLGTGMLNASSVATFTLSSLSIGTHPITAHYDGDSNFNASMSADMTQTVNAIELFLPLVIRNSSQPASIKRR